MLGLFFFFWSGQVGAGYIPIADSVRGTRSVLSNASVNSEEFLKWIYKLSTTKNQRQTGRNLLKIGQDTGAPSGRKILHECTEKPSWITRSDYTVKRGNFDHLSNKRMEIFYCFSWFWFSAGHFKLVKLIINFNIHSIFLPDLVSSDAIKF